MLHERLKSREDMTMGKDMKTDVLTARLLSAYSAMPSDEINLDLAISRDDPKFIEHVADGYSMLKHRMHPGSKLELSVKCEGKTFPIRMSAHEIVTCSIGIGEENKYFDNFLMTGCLAQILAQTYLNSPIEKLTDHPVLAGNGIIVTRATILNDMTYFVTDRTEAENMIDFATAR